ncbi:hypothetical protein MUA04_23945 [Enterobacteriaceae bacterium H11S18]|uniref:hypothetical protein n=1 Tax=Dryocola clanedunensis TaxID=2925396 RepID=UPI0022F068C4|nr:hypothetical protein [Dryocola clanedunensis]MCT4713227.1 hypothetical protein [Dryocola clanedunensis]
MSHLTLPEIIHDGEFILTAGTDDNGNPEVVVHAAHGNTFVAFITFDDIPRWVSELDTPSVPLEMVLMAYWAMHQEANNEETMLLFWRWIVAAAFDREQREENGTVQVEWRPGDTRECALYVGKFGAMNLYPCAERLAMANNIEGALIERYGREQGTRNAIEFYVAMKEREGGLTELGRQVLSDLHDTFIRELNDTGLPETPTTH